MFPPEEIRRIILCKSEVGVRSLWSKFSSVSGDLAWQVMATYLIDFSLVSSTIFMLGSRSLIDTWELTTELFPSSRVFWGHLKKWCVFCQLFYFNKLLFSSVQSLSRVWLFVIPWITAYQASLSIISSWSSLKLMSSESVMLSSHLILGRPLLLLPPIFSYESTLRMRWTKYWSFGFSISPFYEYSRLISFRMDWLDLLAVQGTLKSLLQHHILH